MAHVEDGEVRLITRAGLDWTKRYGDLPHAFAKLPCREAIIDGEVVVLDDKGISRFALLQDALSEGAGNKLVFYAFDLVYLDGWDLAASAARQTQGAARATALGTCDRPFGDPAQRPCRRRRQRALRARIRARPGRHRLQTRIRDLSERPLEDLDQDEGAQDRRFRHCRLHDLAGGGRARLAGAWRVGGRRTALSRQGRNRLRQRHAALAAQAAGAAASGRCPARRRAEGHHLGQAGALRPHPLFEPDIRQSASAFRLQGSQGRGTLGSCGQPSASG